MKRNILFGIIALLAGSLLAADSGPKDDVSAAAKKLADASNYSWKMTQDLGANSQFQPGPTTGKTEKDGITWMSSEFGDNTMEAAKKGTKVAVKTDEGWQSSEEAAGGGGGGGGFGRGGFLARRMTTLKLPAQEAQDLATAAKELKKDGDVISGDLTEDGAKSLLSTGFGGRRGGGGGAQAPAPKNAKGSVKFWLKDGSIAKYEFKVSGTVQGFNGDDMDMDRTTTVEISNVGSTKIDLPDEAKKKLS